MENKKCKHCNQIFKVGEHCSGRWFSNHVRWCEKNPSRHDTKNIIIANQKIFNDKLGEIKEFEVSCFKCQNSFIVKEREKLFPSKSVYYCDRSCANSRPQLDITKNKISQALTLPFQKRCCLNCNKLFETKAHLNKRFCSRECVSASRKSSTEYLTYKNACKFKFNVWSYPDKFDLNLIYKHGWYKAKNRGDNLTGVSRDHRISISFGWENNIDPKIMSHPANCKLMTHNENVSKHKKCSLLLEELIKEIENWDNDNK